MAIIENKELLPDITIERRSEERRVTDRRRHDRRAMERRRHERRRNDRRGKNRRRGDRRANSTDHLRTATSSLLTAEERETVLNLVSKLLEKSESKDN